jgi:hypothetical protein
MQETITDREMRVIVEKMRVPVNKFTKVGIIFSRMQKSPRDINHDDQATDNDENGDKK